VSATLHPIALPFQHLLLKPGEPLDHVYFPGNGVCSVTQAMRDGRTVEVATVGNEGLIGLSALSGGRSFVGVLVKVPESAGHVMSVGAFRREMRRRGAFAELIARYARGFTASLIQSAACNALHSVEERCARWLLTTRDHAGRNEFAVTQELVASLLGVRRPSVTVAIGALQRAGYVDWGHHHIVILDRAGLESASCECYGVVKRRFARLSA